MQHHASAEFWIDCDQLPAAIRDRADKQFAMLKANPQHPSLQLKKIGDRNGREIWSARITLRYRALGIRLDDGFLWFWIGDHEEFDARIS